MNNQETVSTPIKGIRFTRKKPWLSPDERDRIIMERDRYLKQVQAKLNPVEDGIKAELPADEPYLIVCIGDVHLGSDASVTELFEEILKRVGENENVVILFTGDELEGEKPAYKRTVQDHLTMRIDEQNFIYRRRVIPLIKEGRIVGVLSNYKDHHGTWGTGEGGIDFYYEIVTDNNVAALENSSILRVRKPNGEEIRIRTYHNVPGISGSLAGNVRLENRQRGTADVIVSAHQHTQEAGSVLEIKGAGKNPRRIITIRGGAFKGTADSENRDQFMVKEIGGATSAPPGASLLTADYSGTELQLPITNFPDGELLTRAAVLHHQALQNDALEDLRARIAREVESKPVVTFYPNLSARPATDKDTSLSPYWEKLHYDVHTRLPFLVMTAAEYRAGSKYKDTPQLQETVDFVASHPHARLLVGQMFIDQSVPASGKREKVVEQLLSKLEPLCPKNGQANDHLILAWLFDRIISNEKWKEPVRLPNGNYTDEGGFLPSVAIAGRTGTNFIGNSGRVIVNLHNGEQRKGKARYEFTVYDRFDGAPPVDPTQTLMKKLTEGQFLLDMEKRIDAQRIAVGGQAYVAAFAQRWNPKLEEHDTYIAPGSHSTQSFYRGKHNRTSPSRGGYGAILWPDRQLVVPVSDLERATFFFSISYLYVGLSNMGEIDEWLKKLQKRKGRRE